MELPIACGGQPISKSLRLDLQFNIQMVESHAKENNIHCMASGQQGSELKFFLHCQLLDRSGFFMMEVNFNLQTKTLVNTIKSTKPEMDQAFEQFINSVLSKFTIG